MLCAAQWRPQALANGRCKNCTMLEQCFDYWLLIFVIQLLLSFETFDPGFLSLTVGPSIASFSP
jgi:hypothetical protein